MSPSAGLLADVIPFSCVDGPGNRYVAFLQGCNLNCTACHNPHTIPRATPRARLVTVTELLADVRRVHRFLSGVTVSGGEPTLQPEFVRELFTAVHADAELSHLTTFLDSNGTAPHEVWDLLMPVTDGVMLDLKAFDDDVHRAITGSSNTAVLEAIRLLSGAGKLHEVRLLLVPGVNDGEQALRRTVEWLRTVDPGMRVRVIGFRRHGTRAAARAWPEATAADRDRWRRVLEHAGARPYEMV